MLASRPSSSWVRCACSSLRSEEHTSELQSPDHLACRLLLEKKKLSVGILQRTAIDPAFIHAPKQIPIAKCIGVLATLSSEQTNPKQLRIRHAKPNTILSVTH